MPDKTHKRNKLLRCLIRIVTIAVLAVAGYAIAGYMGMAAAFVPWVTSNHR